MKTCVLLLCCSLAAPVVLWGQAQEFNSPTFKVNVHLVEVYATIYDHKGRFIDGLGRDNFEVFEDGKPQKIATFEPSTHSLSCAILLDTTGSMAEALPRVKNSVVKLIDDLGPEDSVAIYTFDRRMVVRQEFTVDKNAAKRAVLRTRAEGSTALFDAISEGARDLAKRPGKKALVVFTDGDDNSSVLNATAAVTRAKKVGVPLYSIAEGEAAHSAKLQKILSDLSERTGGTAYKVKKAGDIEHIFQDVSRDLRHSYLISYKPPSDSRDGAWRRIDVAIKGLKEFRIRAKQGYFTE